MTTSECGSEPFATSVDDLDRGIPHALRPDVLGVHVVPTGHGSPGVAVMALDRRDQHELAIGEHRRKDVEVREVPAAVVRVVGDEHVARVQLVTEEVDREPHRQRRALVVPAL